MLLSGPHAGMAPSPWVTRWSHLIRPGGQVLDLACGSGRHMRWFAARGHQVLGVDRSPEALASAGVHGETLLADIEQGPWPFMDQGAPRTFDAVVVTNYLWRPLLPTLVASLAEAGVLIYETFGAGNETVGRPSRAEFLLLPGELLGVCSSLFVVAYECGFLDQPDRCVQRIVAVRPSSGAAPRYAL
jgi:SAM-dependent methyltransferase